jgi:hypothetical protein
VKAGGEGHGQRDGDPGARNGSNKAAATFAIVVALVAAIGGAWYVSSTNWSSAGAFDPASHVPKDVDTVAWIGSLGALADGLTEIADRIRGSGGLAEAAKLLLDVPSLDDAGLRAAGLAPQHGAVVFGWRQAYWLVAPLSSAAGADHLLGLFQRRGHPVTELAQQESLRTWQVKDRAGERVVGHLWLKDGLVVGRLAAVSVPSEATPVALEPAEFEIWSAAKRLPSGALDSAGAVISAYSQIGRDDALRRRLRRSLGPASLLFGRYVGSFTRVSVNLRIKAGEPSLDVRLYGPKAQAAEIQRYHHAFITDDKELVDFGDVLPDEVTALARARVNPNLVAMISGVVGLAGGVDLGLVDRSLRSLDMRSLLLDPFDGQLAVAVLGISDDATPDLRRWRGDGWRKMAGVAVAVALKTDTAAAHLLDRIRQRLEDDKISVRDAKLGPWTGLHRESGKASWSLLKRGRAVLWILGDGELARFERVAAGRFPSLAKTLEGDLERAAVTGKGQWLSLLVTTGRAVRSARRRGIPDAITAMVASVTAVAAGVELHEDGATIRLSVRPAPKSRNKQAALSNRGPSNKHGAAGKRDAR